MQGDERVKVTVYTSLNLNRDRILRTWADNTFRKKAPLVEMLLNRIIDLIDEHGLTSSPVEAIASRLTLQTS